MKKAYIIITTSALLLCVGSFVVGTVQAAKQNLKIKAPASSAYYLVGTVWHTFMAGGGGAFFCLLTTTPTTGKTAKFTTFGGTHTLYWSKSTSILFKLYH
jgi:hypothetical protein